MNQKHEKKKMKNYQIPGLTRQDEERHLSETMKLAQHNLEAARGQVTRLNEELEDLMEVYSTSDKEGLFLWNNAKAQLKETVAGLTRYEKARKKPYFGRIDFSDFGEARDESYYIGRVGIANSEAEPVVIDWRTPVASVYYDNAPGIGTYTVSSEGTFEIDLKRKRSYEIEDDQLKDFYDLDVVANDELLTKYLSKNKSEVLGEIIATIQKEQNRIIRRSPKTNLIVQGVAGSGKTTVAMHRISYILYNYAEFFRPEDFYIIGSNQILLNYITSVLPELDVYGARQMTMEELFTRLLYEDWDEKKYSIHSVDKTDKRNCIKGGSQWFRELEAFCAEYEREQISTADVYLDKSGELLLDHVRIETYIEENPLVSMQSKRLMLNEILYSHYENVILGKHISITQEEKILLDRKYKSYFGKDRWKGSIFELYQDFLSRQLEKGYAIDLPDPSFDVYDLAALAYLYKRIKETDPIREASHLVIDEAQDFGMMAYCALQYCLRGCTYTIMGDTSQNIHFQYGLNDWDELRKLILTGTKDSFLLLRKSYRNTVEISEFATEILRHGDFSIYPVEPIIRHGNPVTVREVVEEPLLVREAIRTIRGWQKQGYETIAVVCRDQEEADYVAGKLKTRIPIRDMDPEHAEFGNGVQVLPVAYTKGLEFDAVLVYDPSEDKYPCDNGHVKMLYVTATRALHELTILHKGSLTPLMGEKVSGEKALRSFAEEKAPEEEETMHPTAREWLERKKAEANLDLELRSYIGPQRIQVKKVEMADSQSNISGVSKRSLNDSMLSGEQTNTNKEGSLNKGSVNHYGRPTGTEPNHSPLLRPIRRTNMTDNRPVNPSNFKYGETPKAQVLSVKGHSRPNTAIRWVKKYKNYAALSSSYGTLMIVPLTDECVRICFLKGQQSALPVSYWAPETQAGLKWSAKESPSVVEIVTARLIVHVEKKDGAIRFLSADRKLLVSENTREPRVIEGTETWEFLDFGKNDRIQSKGTLPTDLTDLNMKTRYISFGAAPMRMPFLVSKRGYALGIASEKTALYCGIPMYGQYVYTEGNGVIDYYFLNGGSTERNMELYKELFGAGNR